MQNPQTPTQNYQNAIELIENVRLETQLKGRDGDKHRAAVQMIVALFNEWTAQAKEMTDLKSQIAALTNDAEQESSKKSNVTPGQT